VFLWLLETYIGIRSPRCVLLSIRFFAPCDDSWGGPLVRSRRPRRLAALVGRL